MKPNILKKLRFTSILVATVAAASGCTSLQQIIPGSSEPSLGRATANDQSDRVGRHFYAATGVGASRMNPDASEVPSFSVNDRVEAGGQVTLGVDLSRQLSVEVHSADLGSAGFSPGGRINYHINGASALVYAGKNRHNFKRRGLSGYGRVGVGFLENTPVGDVPFVKDNDAHVLFGAGVEYMTRIGLGVRAEGIAFEEDAQYAQLGVIYRTGRRQQNEAVEIVQAPEPAPIPAAAAPEPEPIPEPVAYDPCEQFTGVLEGVNFHTDSDRLTDEAQQNLDGVASTLSECDTAPVSISAHTDSDGSESYNQDLSRRRAASVVEYLIGRGIESDRMSATAYGETQPIASNATSEGKRKNRRVELIAR